MQAVYEVLNEKFVIQEIYDGERAKWLASAIVRCFKSALAVKDKPIQVSLFAGRRSAGLDFMIIQTLALNQLLASSASSSQFFGTSSVTVSEYLEREAGIVIKTVGTHAHELSMVLGSVLYEYDDYAGAPVSQALGHLMYHTFSSLGLPKTAALPDSLGTSTFIKTTKNLVHPVTKVPFIEHFSVIRQDSGKMADFQKTWTTEWGSELNSIASAQVLMASEIDTVKDVEDAVELGYKHMGAGGFFGDSLTEGVKMAVKALVVYRDGKSYSIGSPVKTGDTASNGKLEMDGLLDETNKAAVLKRIANLRSNDAVQASKLPQKLGCSSAPACKAPEGVDRKQFVLDYLWSQVTSPMCKLK
jgi:nicotinic acid phosphoribosyltransferase